MRMHRTQSLSDGAEAGIRPIRRRGRADHVGAGRGAVSLPWCYVHQGVVDKNAMALRSPHRVFLYRATTVTTEMNGNN